MQQEISCERVRKVYGKGRHAFEAVRAASFQVAQSEFVSLLGPSGCGKSTLLRHMIGLNEPAKGEVFYGDVNFTQAAPEEREKLLRAVGVLYQSGALWSSMTLAENIGLPLGEPRLTRLECVNEGLGRAVF
jgi:phospholipid/cholesterol/gamma-HCH transport system ATP-binding protein